MEWSPHEYQIGMYKTCVQSFLYIVMRVVTSQWGLTRPSSKYIRGGLVGNVVPTVIPWIPSLLYLFFSSMATLSALRPVLQDIEWIIYLSFLHGGKTSVLIRLHMSFLNGCFTCPPSKVLREAFHFGRRLSVNNGVYPSFLHGKEWDMASRGASWGLPEDYLRITW